MKIPSHAKHVFQGKLFSVYQWEQEMYDGSKEIFEAIRRIGTVQIIPTSGDKVFLSYEEQPGKPRSHTLFGGRMEEGEDSLVTAKRELLEETGMESDTWELYKEFIPEGKIEWPMYLYIAKNCRKITEPTLDAGERIDIKEVSFDEFMTAVCREDFWGDNISLMMYRLKENKDKLEAFKKKLF